MISFFSLKRSFPWPLWHLLRGILQCLEAPLLAHSPLIIKQQNSSRLGLRLFYHSYPLLWFSHSKIDWASDTLDLHIHPDAYSTSLSIPGTSSQHVQMEFMICTLPSKVILLYYFFLINDPTNHSTILSQTSFRSQKTSRSLFLNPSYPINYQVNQFYFLNMPQWIHISNWYSHSLLPCLCVAIFLKSTTLLGKLLVLCAQTVILFLYY